MAVAYKGAGAAYNTVTDASHANSGIAVPARPTTYAAGDFFLTVIYSNNQLERSDLTSLPAGWTYVSSSAAHTDTWVGGLICFKKFATASEPSSYTFDFRGAFGAIYMRTQIYSFTGLDNNDPISGWSIRNYEAMNSGTLTYPSLELPHEGAMALRLGCVSGENDVPTLTHPPTGHTTIAKGSVSNATHKEAIIGAASYIFPAAGSTSVASIGVSAGALNAADNFQDTHLTGMTMSLRPSSPPDKKIYLFRGAGNGDTRTISQSASYYPPDPTLDDPTLPDPTEVPVVTSTLASQKIERSLISGKYHVSNALMSFDTSSLPDDNPIVSANLRLFSKNRTGSMYSIQGDYHNWNGTSSDWSNTPNKNAITSTSVLPGIPLRSSMVPLINPYHLNRNGISKIRMGMIDTANTPPTTVNSDIWHHYNNHYQFNGDTPTLVVEVDTTRTGSGAPIANNNSVGSVGGGL